MQLLDPSAEHASNLTLTILIPRLIKRQYALDKKLKKSNSINEEKNN